VSHIREFIFDAEQLNKMYQGRQTVLDSLKDDSLSVLNSKEVFFDLS
jgi:hypothetical protein